MNSEFYVHGVNGPIVRVRGGEDLPMMSLVYVGEQEIFGEMVASHGEDSIIQIYESAVGLKYGDKVRATYEPLSMDLGPGLLGNIFDGIGRPLKAVEKEVGAFIKAGVNVSSLDMEKKWHTRILVELGDFLTSGEVYATCQETKVIEHKCLVPNGIAGKVIAVSGDGDYDLNEVLIVLEDKKGKRHDLKLYQKWAVRQARPYNKRLPISKPLVTGQRIIDTLFPLAKGGCAAVPGPFGAGKTVVQHQLAKWSDADIVVYLGCGERGNEMTQVLDEFKNLVDPKTGEALMERTILIANTSNMPVAAREASIYTGITIAEYYRDMGYHVALMADSTSRWAEALRELSGRLEEMPADESFPAYLPSRLAGFYERAGYVETLCKEEGSITIIGAVSPQGGDFSEPVTQNTQRFVSCFWALDRSLAYARHFPSINWNLSYSEYFTALEPWYKENFGADFSKLRRQLVDILHYESRLMEIVKLIGADILPDDQKLVIETAKVIRQGYLQQNAFHERDTYMTAKNQMLMLRVILHLYDEALLLVQKSIPVKQLVETGIFAKLSRMKFELDENSVEASYIKLVDEAVALVRKNNA